MRNIILGVLVAIVLFFTFKHFNTKKADEAELLEQSMLIQEQIKNVGKLVVTEGHFSEVFSYKDSRDVFPYLVTAEKKALVVVNADVTIAYDLSKIVYDIDEVNKVLNITYIPDEEIKISPEFEYYDIQADFLNQFEAKDYNKIKNKVKASLMKKVEQSEFKKNSKNRLISELAKFYILTNSLGWTLQYNNTPISQEASLQDLKL
ncbi:DUF4230 domain-containing protein [Formosa algae]|uniref:DUF4230 domain-containing protein n=1 Tax=Formosa algae TaxID=225843 RepID=A0A9X1CAF7_9FLAO|nr:DUF4230 domain-containing protein [Formosa algae]MBP1838130.1 hypothetical protein [Formosa algae]MDQ0334265.1 hypothetical protein [Formosa algae]OEI80088.1 hypothetical protein AST99_11070 [Formosa algae]PNW29847.1 hypothetical protein BKP44_01600 [Formosa algae]